ncbi:MAG: hypothetical protein ACR2NQ_03115 [Thermodesulfobacteriota bacterium]
MAKKFRNAASFGKRIEFWIIGEMMKEGLDVYVPLVDDMGIDAIVRQSEGKFIEVQIKARSKDVKNPRDAALFSAIKHEHRENYWFVFYSEGMDTKWIMSSEEFIEESRQNDKGKNKGKRSIWLNGRRKNKETGEYELYTLPQFEKYVEEDFRRLKDDTK